MWLAATHYFESEVINKLITHIKIHREAIKSKPLGGNVLIKCSLFMAFDSLYCRKTAKPRMYSATPTTVCWFAVSLNLKIIICESIILNFLFLLLSINWIDFSFLYVKDALVHIECEAVFQLSW